MRKKLCLGLVFLLVMMLTGCAPDKEAIEKQAMKKQAIEKQIKKQVDEVVAAIDSGKKAEDFKKLATEPKYYIYIGGKWKLFGSSRLDVFKGFSFKRAKKGNS